MRGRRKTERDKQTNKKESNYSANLPMVDAVIYNIHIMDMCTTHGCNNNNKKRRKKAGMSYYFAFLKKWNPLFFKYHAE